VAGRCGLAWPLGWANWPGLAAFSLFFFLKTTLCLKKITK
jgi:hypothetical protein